MPQASMHTGLYSDFSQCQQMEASMERMPIACVHCAKAKAKCDKKVPCSRCVAKQILCQSRPTRRSSNMASRRANGIRARPESLPTSTRFRLSELPHTDLGQAMLGNGLDLDVCGTVKKGCSSATLQFGTHVPHRQSLPIIDYTVPFGNGLAVREQEPQLVRTGFSESPPDLSTSITPVEQDYQKLDEMMPFSDSWDPAAYDHLLSMGGDSDVSTAFDMANILDFLGPQQMSPLPDEFKEAPSKGSTLPRVYVEPKTRSPRPASLSLYPGGSMDLDTPAEPAHRSGEPGYADGSRGSVGPLASPESWPFFSCNRVPQSGCFPPATAAIYVGGLVRVLNTHDWHVSRDPRHGGDEKVVNELLKGEKMMEPIAGHSMEVLNAATQAILHKACTTHRTEQGSIDGIPNILTGKDNQATIQLPPPVVIGRFLESYIGHHKPYYVCAADLTRSNAPMLQSNVHASRLLMLLTIAQGAAFVPIPAARYLASGLIEACRLFLFDSIEKDILLSRDPTILHSALLFTTAAAWSGDNWHMDIAMGQRGMYIAMMSHARMFDRQDQPADAGVCRQSSARKWEEWRLSQEKRRIAYSWVIVDQELSLFSDTTPLLNVVVLQVPMPSSEYQWEARSADEWDSRFSEASEDRHMDGLSLRDLFTRFVEGDLSSTDAKPSPLQLRLLLHPLQTLVCQLRQFLSCLPDSGRQSLGTSISKVAIKARLEEISTLLRQWYRFTKRHINGDGKICWTTRANLIMYHLISLNIKTSLGFIEQFARGEVRCACARHASQWLHVHCIDDAEQVNFHCGQILRLIKSIPANLRPPWWSGAVYRAALIAWATSMASVGARVATENTPEVDEPFAIDNLGPEHPSIEQYLRYKEGMPMLSQRDGTLVPMGAPNNVLQHCISILAEDLSMRATEGVMSKLQSLLDRWRNPPFAAKS